MESRFPVLQDYWYISVSVETNYQPPLCENQASVGVDLGIKTLATFSDGKTFPNHRPLKKQLDRLKTTSKAIIPTAKKAQRTAPKTKNKIAKLHYK